MRNNRDDNKREIYKKADNKRKKEKHDNINTHEKELLNNYEKKGKRKVLNNLDDDKREEVKESDKIRKKEMRHNLYPN